MNDNKKVFIEDYIHAKVEETEGVITAHERAQWAPLKLALFFLKVQQWIREYEQEYYGDGTKRPAPGVM